MVTANILIQCKLVVASGFDFEQSARAQHQRSDSFPHLVAIVGCAGPNDEYCAIRRVLTRDVEAQLWLTHRCVPIVPEVDLPRAGVVHPLLVVAT